MSDAMSTTNIRLRRGLRRLSTPTTTRRPRLQVCRQTHPHSLDALDLSTASPTQTLASLRFLLLSYLADLETRLSQLASPISEFGLADALKAQGESTIEEARAWAKVALEMLDGIRADVRSHLPEFHIADMSVEGFVKSHLPDMPDVAALNDNMRSHLPDMPDVRSHLPEIPDVRSHLPDMPDVRSHLPDFKLSDMRSKLDSVRTRISELDFHQPLNFIPILCDRLQSLHSHLSSMELHADFEISVPAPSNLLSDLLDTLRSSDIVSDLLNVSPDVCAEDMLGRAAKEIAGAVKRSLHGARLIKYADLPEQWRHNPFVRQGYRFIPIERWPRIIMSLFAFHNETLNIHTHLVPFVLWGWHATPFLSSSPLRDIPEATFTAFALLCLFASALWHTMSGCAHPAGMEFFARADYVGIGWLISASVGSVVHYGFQCHPKIGNFFLVFCFFTGLAGNVFPFMNWFNQYEYRGWRILFFLSLAFSAVAPLAALSYLHSPGEVLLFIAPVVPSLVSYVAGLVFYVTHFPERILSERWCRRLDFVGGGSHAIWHAFIVLAISQHKAAIWQMRDGVSCG